MDGHEETVVALAYGRAREAIRTSVLPLSLLHIHDHLLERIRLLLDLATANWRQQEARMLVDVRLSCVDLSAGLAREVFFRLSVLDSLGPHYRAMDDHVFVHVALPHIADRAQSDLLQRRHIRKPNIDPFLDLHELLHALVHLIGDQL